MKPNTLLLMVTVRYVSHSSPVMQSVCPRLKRSHSSGVCYDQALILHQVTEVLVQLSYKERDRQVVGLFGLFIDVTLQWFEMVMQCEEDSEGKTGNNEHNGT